MNAEHIDQNIQYNVPQHNQLIQQHNQPIQQNNQPIQQNVKQEANDDDNLDLNNLDNKTLQEYLIKAVEYIKELQKQKNTLIALIKNESMRKDDANNENMETNKKLMACNKKNKHMHKKIINIIFLVGILIVLFFVLYIKAKNKICI